MIRLCNNCGIVLSDERKRWCSSECGWIFNSEKNRKIKREKFYHDFKYKSMINNSSNNAIIEIFKLINN